MGILLSLMLPHPPLIIPEIGRGQERKIQKTIQEYQKCACLIGEMKIDTIVLLSPHQTMYLDYFHISPGSGAKGNFASFQAGQVSMEVSYDKEFVDELCKLASREGIPAGTAGERNPQLDHGTMVPLYFVNQFWTRYRLVRIGLSGLPLTDHYKLGQLIQETAEKLNRRTAVIASGDLSHRLMEDGPYGYQKEGPEYDKRIVDVMGKAAFGELFEFSEEFCDKAGECGHRSFTIMAGALDRISVRPCFYSYEGPFGVGYGICSYITEGEDSCRNFLEQYEAKEKEKVRKQREKEDIYVQLARKTIETYIRTGDLPEVSPESLPEEMRSRRAGVFVSIKKNGKLRGCIGTIQAVQPSIAQEILANAVSAAVRDPRFSPIEETELSQLTISVDVLGERERISSPDQLDVERYGVIVTKGNKRGLLLPNLEGVERVEDQIRIAKQKAGIGQEEEVLLERFEVVRHH